MEITQARLSSIGSVQCLAADLACLKFVILGSFRLSFTTACWFPKSVVTFLDVTSGLLFGIPVDFWPVSLATLERVTEVKGDHLEI